MTSLRNIPVYTLDPLADSRWEEFVQRHPRATVFHSTEWMSTLNRTYGYKPLIVTTLLPGDEITNGLALCQIESRLTGMRAVSLPFSDHCDPLVTDQSQYEDLLVSLQRIRDEANYKYVELRQRSTDFSVAPGFGISGRYWLHTLDLTPDLQDIFRRFHRSCIQRRIHHAERMDLNYHESRSESALSSFYRLQVLTRARHNLPPQPLKWFQNLLKAFGDRLTIHTVSTHGLTIASIITLRHGRTLTYKYGASDSSYHHLGGMILLFWRAIQSAKASGMMQMDLGRCDLGSPSLAEFKEHLGASRSEIFYWRSPEPSSQAAENLLFAVAERVFAHTPQPIAQVVGSWLYKHAG
jgi:hypothetical protein